MRNLIKVTGLFLVCVMLHLDATAKDIFDGVYVKAGAGAMYFEKFKATRTESHDGYEEKAPKRICPIINVGVGYKFNKSIRSDINFQYTKIKYKTSDFKQGIRSMSVFVNGYYDFNFHDKFIPYLALGVGVGTNKAGDLKNTESFFQQGAGKTKTNFIWNIGAGVQYIFNPCYTIDLWYRYMDLGIVKTADNTDEFMLGGKQRLKSHQLTLSLIYNF